MQAQPAMKTTTEPETESETEPETDAIHESQHDERQQRFVGLFGFLACFFFFCYLQVLFVICSPGT